MSFMRNSGRLFTWGNILHEPRGPNIGGPGGLEPILGPMKSAPMATPPHVRIKHLCHSAPVAVRPIRTH